jgi:DNA replicative helicase MCM subunit Mcm2 (Cdc46/Mcm family)
LTDKVTPGNRVTITGIYSIKRLLGGKAKAGREDKVAGMAGIRAPYIRAVGIEVQMSGPGRSDQMQFTSEEERFFKVRPNYLKILLILPNWKYSISIYYIKFFYIHRIWPKIQMCIK